MGHYYADLMCDRCGKLPCICPPKAPEKRGPVFVIHEYEVLTLEEWKAKRVALLGRGAQPADFLAEMVIEKFPTKETAENAAKRMLDSDIRHLNQRLHRLTTLRDSKERTSSGSKES